MISIWIVFVTIQISDYFFSRINDIIGLVLWSEDNFSVHVSGDVLTGSVLQFFQNWFVSAKVGGKRKDRPSTYSRKAKKTPDSKRH